MKGLGRAVGIPRSVHHASLSHGQKSGVEDLFQKHFANTEVIAFGIADEEWGEKLCIGLTTNLSLSDVQAKLIGINSPKEIFVFNQIPRTTLGKVDRKAAIKLALGK